MSERPFSVASAYVMRSDVLLGMVALLGVVLFIWTMPQQHPDAAADARLGEEGAIEAAETFLTDRNYATEHLRAEARFRRDEDLVMTLQRRYGRAAAVSLIRSDTYLAVYHWRVRFRSEDDTELRYTVYLTAQGEVSRFVRERGGLQDPLAEEPRAPLDRAALANLLPSAEDEALLHEVPDSLLRLRYAIGDRAWGEPEAYLEPRVDVVAWLEERAAGTGEAILDIGPAEAASLARYHLGQTALHTLDMRVDSVWLAIDRSMRSPARARFISQDAYAGLTIEATVDVMPTGRLERIQVEINDPNEDRDQTLVAGVSPGDLYDGVTVVAFLILVVGLIMLFVRRLSARLLDARAALRDALLAGILAVIAVLLSIVPVMWQEMPNVGLALFVVTSSIAVVGLGGAGAIFVVSSAVDALARESWPAKLETITRFRQGALRTVPAGVAVLRGIAFGGVLLGVITIVLLLLPGVVVDVTQENGIFPPYPLPFIVWTAGYGWYVLFLSLAFLLGVGTFLYRYRASGPLVVLGIAVLFALTQTSPVQVEPVFATGLFAACIGAATGLAFWHYSVITGGIGLLLMFLSWQTLPGWLVAGSPIAVAPILLILLVGALLVYGLVAAGSGRVGADVSRYVPDYIREVTHKQRMERELEIAREVQRSFLPRRMPEMEGVDVAAMCLPAHEVGGDYYDFIELEPGRLGVVIGDVSGKGIQAAFFMTLAKGFLQTLARTEGSPAEVLRQLNTLFYENATRGTFISMIYGILDVETRTFTFARAGHNPLLQYRVEGEETELIRPSGLGIGLATGLPFDEAIQEHTLVLSPGDVLVFYTDGFSEAMNRRKEQYGDPKLARKIQLLGPEPARDILRGITEDVTRFIEGEGRHDDMTMIVLKLSPVEAPSSRPVSHRKQEIPVTS